MRWARGLVVACSFLGMAAEVSGQPSPAPRTRKLISKIAIALDNPKVTAATAKALAPKLSCAVQVSCDLEGLGRRHAIGTVVDPTGLVVFSPISLEHDYAQLTASYFDGTPRDPLKLSNFEIAIGDAKPLACDLVGVDRAADLGLLKVRGAAKLTSTGDDVAPGIADLQQYAIVLPPKPEAVAQHLTTIEPGRFVAHEGPGRIFAEMSSSSPDRDTGLITVHRAPAAAPVFDVAGKFAGVVTYAYPKMKGGLPLHQLLPAAQVKAVVDKLQSR